MLNWLFTLIILSSAAAFVGDLSPASAPETNYVLVWSDEFSAANGSLPDPSRWIMETGGGGWGNHELESYTNRAPNAHVQNGNLVITAKKEIYKGTDGITRQYTSARLKTLGLFEQKYGRFEARIKIPRGQGIWPAFWMLGNNIGTVDWPDRRDRHHGEHWKRAGQSSWHHSRSRLLGSKRTG